MGAAITTPLPEKPEDEEQKDVGSIKEERKEARGAVGEDKKASNYFSIHGTIAGGLVAAKSNLAVEVL